MKFEFASKTNAREKDLSSSKASYCVLALLASACAASISASAQCVPEPSGLIGWWPGEGDANTVVGTNNGSLLGGATANAVGEVGQAFNLDGTNGFVSIPDAPGLRPTNLTVECWVRFNSLDSSGTAPAGQQYLVFKQNSRSTVFEGFSLHKARFTNPTRDLFVFGIASSAGQIAETVATNVISPGVWYHVAGVRGSNYTQIYVNGQLRAQTTVAFAQDYGSFPLYFGTSGQSYWDRKLNGRLDEVSLYHRALSAAEIAAIHAAGAAGKCNGLGFATHPQDQTVVVGSNATFTAIATGTPPLTYQWQFNGEILPDATTTNLVLTNVQTTHAGNYALVVSDATSSLTSAVAVLTVLVPPSFETQPQSATNEVGTVASFAARATGSAPLGYRWQRNGLPLTNGGRISGDTTTNLLIADVQYGDAGNYTLVVSNLAGVVTSDVAVLTVNGPPAVQTHPASRIIAAGQDVTFGVVASGTQPLSYHWQRNESDLMDGGGVSGATSSALTLFSVTTNSAGGYRVVITNSLGAVTSEVALLTVHLPPSIITQPVGQTVVFGTNVTFTVAATGTEPLGYQWRLNGTNLVNNAQYSGVTNPTLSLTYAMPVNAGDYSVMVTNLVGTNISTAATLTVVPPTDCTLPPPGLIGWWPGDGHARDIVGTNNGTLYSNATASAAGVVGQAFQFDGTNSYMAIPDSPVLRPATLSVECWVLFTSLNGIGNSPLPGQQYMVFKNNSRNCSSFEAFVLSKDRVASGDVFLWEVTSPSGRLIRTDSKTKVTTNVWYHVVGVAGSNYLEMYVNGVMETNTTFDFPLDYGLGKPLMFGSSGESCYDRKLHGLLDEVALYNRPLTSNEVAALYAGALAGKCKGTNGLIIAAQPESQAVMPGSDVSFSVTALGGSPIGYQWQFNGANIIGATSSSLTVSNAQIGDVGEYQVVLTNGSGAVASAVASLTLLQPPVITTQPTNQTAVAGQNVMFHVAAEGDAPLSYQWQFNGTNLDGEISDTLLLTDVLPSQAGDYSVVVSNLVDVISSDVATLTVLEPPAILVPPSNHIATIGETVTFTVLAAGSEPLAYHWEFNGHELEGETAATLTLYNVQPDQAGNYSVILSNAAGVTNSAPANLAVISQVVLLSPLQAGPETFAFTLQGPAGHLYAIEVTTNFDAWTELTTVTNPTGQAQFIDLTSSNVLTRFYRARLVE